jgi:two-component sensor histidine kinase
MAVALQTGRYFQNQEVVIEQPDGERVTVLVSIAPLKDEAGHVSGAINCFQDITDRKHAEVRQHQLVSELNHRVKNTIATIQAMAAITASNASSIDEFASHFEARLVALSQAHSLLCEGQWGEAKLREVLAQQLKPFEGEQSSRVQLEGPEIRLQPQLALTLSMIVHELMTNAAKYGSLSVAGGRLLVAWDLVAGAEGDRELTLQWVEAGGPTVTVPQRKGFGTRLIERAVTADLGGQINLLFEPSGLKGLMSIPLRTS